MSLESLEVNDEDSAKLNDLVRRARAGCSSAKEQLFAETRTRLSPIAKVRVGNRFGGKVDGSDIVQDVLMRAWRRFEQANGNSDLEFYAWCLRILANDIINFERLFGAEKRGQGWNQVTGSSGDGQFAAGSSSSPPRQASRKEEVALVSAALSRLSSDHETVIRLRMFDGKTWAEVAATMGRSEDAVQKLYLRALEKLEQDDQLPSEFGEDA